MTAPLPITTMTPHPDATSACEHEHEHEHAPAPAARWSIQAVTGATVNHISPASMGPPGYLARYKARPTAPGEARRDAVRALEAWGLGQLVETARLLVSELVTNAVVHTDSRRIGVAVTRTTETTVRIVVLDVGRTRVPASRPPGDDEESGRGFCLVAALADRWGIEYVTTGKRVWCELDAGGPDAGGLGAGAMAKP
ncbi:ATP-binding protein [Streptomyces sp. NPDC046203]|uniref:ATP-binding protein n=1 Tax=Streptomyces sp. NPDC046203 TaxID=3154602 RepID=UPI003409AF0C